MDKVLIVVTGLPCTGKTHLARRIAGEFRLPLIHKDGIKEILFDSLGWSDRAWSRKLSQASYSLIYYFLDAQLAAGYSLVVESNFDPQRDTPKLRDLLRAYACRAVQVQCVTQGETLWQRFKTRAESGQRHPGHVDRQNYAEFEAALLRGRLDPLEIGGHYLEVDTTGFERIDLPGLYAAIRRAAGDG